jgi:hypothetical protein
MSLEDQMRAHLVIGLGVAAVGLLAFACTVEKNNDPFPDQPAFCAAKAKAECQIANLCAIDGAACQGYRAQLCAQDAAAALASGARAYKSDNAQACIDALNGAYGSGANEIPYSKLVGKDSIQDKCARVFAGSADKNQPCKSDYDCKDNRICSPVTPGAPQSVCADTVSKALNDFCGDPGSQCATDTYCGQQSNGTYQCIAAAPAGAPCDAKTPCVSSQHCAGGSCQARGTGGSPCTTSDDCGGGDPYCDPYAGNICTVGLTFATRAIDCNGYVPGTADAGTPDSGGITDSGSGSEGGSAEAGGDAAGD